MSEPRGPAPTRGGMAQAVGEQFSLQMSVGGVRGLVESALPVVVFTLIYALTQQLVPAVGAAVVVAVLLTVVRLVQRQSVLQAVSGLFGVLIGAAIAYVTGQAINFFALGIVRNGLFLLAFLISIAVRWPLVGVFLGFVLQEGTHWRSVPARRRAYMLASWVWVGMFALRLAFQIPLYLRERVTDLGVASIPLGVPLYALVLFTTWAILRRVPPALPPRPDEQEAGRQQDDVSAAAGPAPADPQTPGRG
jgi:hypothetical protein